MKARFISTEGDYLEAKIEIDGTIFSVMDDFNGKTCEIGDEIDISLSESITDPGVWDDIFNSNPDKEKKLINTGGWEYLCLGEVIAVSPVTVDCDIMKIEEPFFTNDRRCIGEFVGFKMARLSATAITG